MFKLMSFLTDWQLNLQYDKFSSFPDIKDIIRRAKEEKQRKRQQDDALIYDKEI
jgi:hypothetical protein